MTRRPAPIHRAVLALILALAAGGSQADELRGRVIAIADGDTLTVLDAGNTPHRIRLAGIDAPEKRQAYAQAEAEARARHRGLWNDPDPVAPWDWRAASRAAGGR